MIKKIIALASMNKSGNPGTGNPSGGGGEDLLAMRISNTLTEYENNEIGTINDYSFHSCESLKSIKSTSVTLIRNNAFCLARGLETAYFPNLTDLCVGAFRQCYNLKEVVFRKLNCFRLDAETFGDCSKLEKVDLGKVTNISGYGVFKNCGALTALILRQSDVIVNLTVNTAFLNSSIANGTGLIYVPNSLLEQYKTATNWSVFAEQFRAIEGSEYE